MYKRQKQGKWAEDQASAPEHAHETASPGSVERETSPDAAEGAASAGVTREGTQAASVRSNLPSPEGLVSPTWNHIQVEPIPGSHRAQAASIATTTVKMGGSPADAAAAAAARLRGEGASAEDIQLAAGLAASVAVLAAGGNEEDARWEAVLAAMEEGAGEIKATTVSRESLETAQEVTGPMLATEPDREKVEH